MDTFAKQIVAALELPMLWSDGAAAEFRATLCGTQQPPESVIGAMQCSIATGIIPPFLGPEWTRIYRAALAKVTAHRWCVEEALPYETRERCDGHCQAICRRNRATGLLNSFDSEGQRPRTEREYRGSE